MIPPTTATPVGPEKVAVEPAPSALPAVVQPAQPPPASVVTTAAGMHGDGDGVRERLADAVRLRDVVTLEVAEADDDALALALCDAVGVGDSATPDMLADPKLMFLVPVDSLVESKMRAHMTGWSAAAAGSVADVVVKDAPPDTPGEKDTAPAGASEVMAAPELATQ